VSRKGAFNPAKKYSPTELQEEFSILQKALYANHPSLYWYTSKDSVDGYFASTYASLQDSLTQPQFRNKIAWAISKIRCGHTTVRLSKNAAPYLNRQRSAQFPLLLKVWNDSAVVIANVSATDSTLQRGTIVTAINGKPTSQILDSLCQLIGTDGYANNFKYQAISFNFPAYYRNAFGSDSLYAVTYVDTTGLLKERTLKAFFPKPDSTEKVDEPFSNKITRKQLKQLRLNGYRNFRIDTALQTAFMSVNTFSEGKLVRFFRKSFKKIKQQQLKNVVIDLRLNTGGSVIASTRLSQYLIDKPFRIADTIAAVSRSFEHKKYIKPWFIYWLSMHLSGRKSKEDGRIHFRYFEKHQYKPEKKNHFDGNIYLLTGGYTFSAATLVTAHLKGQQNVTIVGEETGGGSYGNTAMHLTTIVLPNTGVRVTLPLYRMVLNATRPKNGRGVFPDVEVNPSSTYIKQNVDAKMENVKELIKTHNPQ